jgi:hypothetical protein
MQCVPDPRFPRPISIDFQDPVFVPHEKAPRSSRRGPAGRPSAQRTAAGQGTDLSLVLGRRAWRGSTPRCCDARRGPGALLRRAFWPAPGQLK